MHTTNITLPSYFGAALVINLADRTDRRRLTERELYSVGWSNVQFFSAFRFDETAGFKLSSWRGCFYSHLGCLQLAHEQNLESVLIFEDDIALSSSIPRLTPSIIEIIPKLDWDFLYFGHEQTGDISRATRKTDRVAFERCTIEFPTAHFYAVNRRIIPRLISHFERLARGTPGDNDFGPMLPDGAFNTFRRHNKEVNTYIAIPKLGWQRPSRSDISPGLFDGVEAFRPFGTFARNIKRILNRD